MRANISIWPDRWSAAPPTVMLGTCSCGGASQAWEVLCYCRTCRPSPKRETSRRHVQGEQMGANARDAVDGLRCGGVMGERVEVVGASRWRQRLALLSTWMDRGEGGENRAAAEVSWGFGALPRDGESRDWEDTWCGGSVVNAAGKKRGKERAEEKAYEKIMLHVVGPSTLAVSSNGAGRSRDAIPRRISSVFL